MRKRRNDPNRLIVKPSELHDWARTQPEPSPEQTIEIEGRRPTVTRVGTGLLLGGPIGGLLGFAFRKKTKQKGKIR